MMMSVRLWGQWRGWQCHSSVFTPLSPSRSELVLRAAVTSLHPAFESPVLTRLPVQCPPGRAPLQENPIVGRQSRLGEGEVVAKPVVVVVVVVVVVGLSPLSSHYKTIFTSIYEDSSLVRHNLTLANSPEPTNCPENIPITDPNTNSSNTSVLTADF